MGKDRKIKLSRDDPFWKALERFGPIELPPETEIDHIEEFGEIKSIKEVLSRWAKSVHKRKEGYEASK